MIKKTIKSTCLIGLLAAVAFPGLVWAGIATTYDAPDSGYISNVVIDIVEHNGGVWFATSEGVNFSFDNGQTWLSYDNTNGLVSNNVSAIFSLPNGPSSDRIWVGTSHEIEFQGDLYQYSDAVSYSDDDGDAWTQIIFDSTGLDIPYVFGVDRTVYDIAGHYDPGDPADDWLFFTAFAGGLLASRDAGITWRRIYSSRADSAQFNNEDGAPPSFRNRYFSCAVDTSHGDSLLLWGGTAEGFFEYIFAAPRDKAYNKHINRIAFCETCPEDSNFMYLAGEEGLTRSLKTGSPYITRMEEDGLPGQAVISVIDYGGRIYAGTVDPLDSSSTGLAESIDFGESFTTSTSFTETGANNRIQDFTVMNGRLYMAAEEAGLYVTEDNGISWAPVVFTPPDPAHGIVNALCTWADTLIIGTDSGVGFLFMDPAGVIDSTRFFTFPETDSSSAQVIRIKTQTYLDTLVIWTINRPMTESGTPIVGRSLNNGQTFARMQVGVTSYDINFFGDSAFVVTEDRIRLSDDGDNPDEIYQVREFQSGVPSDSLDLDIITVMEVLGDTVYLGTDNGFAVSFDRGDNWDIRRVNKDTLAPDAVLQYTQSIQGINGDFIPAIEVQNLEDTLSRIWVSCRPALEGVTGISVGRIDQAWRYFYDSTGAIVDSDYVYLYNWDSVYHDYAWNFAFDGDRVFAATNGGVIYAEGTNLLQGDLAWDTLVLQDSLGDPFLLPQTPIYAVEVIGDYLWVGTDDRTVRVSLDDFTDQTPFFVVDPASEVYAFPVPFSQSLDQAVEFHFVVEQDAYVTLEIYDFAMNLVRRVIDNQYYPAGIYPTAGSGRRTWDGVNGRGDVVAVGMYYFKLEYSTGEVQWGKLAVIP
ncbi:MAG: hypothetical protein AB1483_03870 [Candidatus Zixiibacteriota bacterium]